MIKKTDHIVTAYAQSGSGPGWGNAPIWVIVRSKLDGTLREECIQPEDQTKDMMLLYRVSQVAHNAMTNAVQQKFKRE